MRPVFLSALSLLLFAEPAWAQAVPASASQPATIPAGEPLAGQSEIGQPLVVAPDLSPVRQHEAEEQALEQAGILEEDIEATHEILRRGPFSIRLGAVIQVAGAFYVGDGAAMQNADPADTEGFRIRRARFGLAGDLLPDVSYMLGVDLKDTVVVALGGDQGSEILDAKIRWHRFPWAQITVGLDKLPFAAFAMQSSSKLTLIERPLTTRLLSPEYRVGLLVSGNWHGLSYGAGLYNGSEGVTSGNRLAGVAGVGHLQYNFFGRPRPGPGPGYDLALGGAYMYDDGPAVSYHRVSANLQGRYRWISLMGELLWQDSAPQDAPAGAPDAGQVSQWGAVGDLGVYVYHDIVQLAARYEYFRANDRLATFGKQQLIYGGANIYFADHNLKLQINYVRRDELEGPEVANDMGFAQLQAMF